VNDQKNSVSIREKALFRNGREGHVHAMGPFRDAGLLPIFDPWMTPDAGEEPAHPALVLGREQEGEGGSQHLLPPVSENTPCPRVPGSDEAFGVDGDHSGSGGFKDELAMFRRALRPNAKRCGG